ncbi:MAG: SDR family oxidoreductase [Leifsonia sp.]
MTDSHPILAVTGATGGIGGMVAAALAASGNPQRLVVRDSARAPDLPGAVVVEAAYGDSEAAVRALDGVDTLFMVSATEDDRRVADHVTFIDAAARAGVRHVVYTSFLGAAPDATFTLARDHWATEQRIAGVGLAHTFLRDSLYADFFRHLVGEDGVIRGPAGSGRLAGVARADVARVATAVLRDPSPHYGHTYELTGPEAISLHEVARILSTGLGRPVSYHEESVDEAYASRAQYGAPAWQVDAWVSTYTAIAAGELATVSRDVERITGRRPLSLPELLAAR